uniref:Uncharacterized protein n=1 Tax=Anguilla anguilla TaxID=7936 RepID=A0A0E9U724_ANGAN
MIYPLSPSVGDATADFVSPCSAAQHTWHRNSGGFDTMGSIHMLEQYFNRMSHPPRCPYFLH